MIFYFPTLFLAEGTLDRVYLAAYGALELWDLKACLQSSQSKKKLEKGVGREEVYCSVGCWRFCGVTLLQHH